MTTRDATLDALHVTCGNVTHAAVLLNISRVHAMRLLRKFKLSNYARDLRKRASGARTGRPKTVDVASLGA